MRLGEGKECFLFVLLTSYVVLFCPATGLGDLGSAMGTGAKLKKSKWSVTATVLAMSNAYEWQSQDHEGSGKLSLSLMRGGDKMDVYAVASMIQQFGGFDEYHISNAVLGVKTKSKKVIGTAKLTHGFSVTLPTYKKQYDESSYRGGIAYVPTVSYQKGRWAASVAAQAQKNWHLYDRSSQGIGNIEYSAAESLSLAYKFSKRWEMELSFEYISGVSYQGSFHSQYSAGQSMAFAPDSNTKVAIGLSSGGNALDASGSRNTIKWYDQYSAQYYGAISKRF
ncbi:MAG: hypothetical protein H6626_04960 [Pseudobdellovibrionaceae bacterium]|nr:MAG: hypothetical protein H6626_04960 [Pseudobdellovibrionaceae bacterium]